MDDNVELEGDEADLDIIQLLNTKKKKNKEILSITDAAVDAVAGCQQPKTISKKVFPAGNGYRKYEDSKQNFDSHSVSVNSSSTSKSSGSKKDISFTGKYKVRVSSSLLREIKSPSERSVSENGKSSDEATTTTKSSLFSSSTSNQSSIQTSGPVPTVIKYSPDPPQLDHKVIIRNQHHNTSHRSPVVIKHAEKYSIHSPGSHQYTAEHHGHKQRTQKITSHDSCAVVPEPVRNESENVMMPESHIELSGNKEHVEESEDRKKKPRNPQRFINETQNFQTGKPKEPGVKVHGTALRQGAPSNNVIHPADSGKGHVKAVSFSLSVKEKATREMLSKRQEKVAIRRVVQPKIVTEKQLTEGDPANEQSKTSSGISQDNNDGTITNRPAVQLSNSLETRMSDLMDTLGAIETKCQESRDWQVLQQQELEKNIKERDERRLQNLEDMQRQLLECQLKYARSIPPVTPHPFPSTSSVGGTTQGLSTIQEQPCPQGPPTVQFQPTAQVQSSTQFQPTIRLPPTAQSTTQVQPTMFGAAVGGTTPCMTQGPPATGHPPQYSVALEHKAPSTFKTSVYNKPTNVTSQSGLKRKFVRNTRTQTSPQYSSSSSSTELSSPLETPLPRKRPPVPMARVSKNERDSSRKRVHFDTPKSRTTNNPVKEKEQQQEITVKRPPNTVGGGSQIKCPVSSFEREETSPLKKPGSSDYIVNDIGKLRQELKDALKETEQTKLSLRNLHDNIHAQISDEDVLSAPDHTQPYPLDAYLRATRDIPEEPDSPKVDETIFPESVDINQPGHYADALCILRDVQRRKETLESNLMSLTRQHDEQHLYRLVDDLSNEGTTSEAMRIKKEVARKIEEISTVVQTELLEERKKEIVEKEAIAENKKSVKFSARSGVPTSAERRAKIRNSGKENQPRAKNVVKGKPPKPVARQPVAKRPLQDESYVSRVYGRSDHMPHRTTLKPPNIQHHSPVASARQITATRDNPKRYQRCNDSVSSTSDDGHTQNVKQKPRYYFQPSLITQSTMKPHSKKIQTPLPGQLLSMAIPLGKPKTDPALRLPVNINEPPSEPSPSKAEVTSALVKQPNVAVITIKDEDSLYKDYESGKARKPKRTKERVTLETQVLPNVDIDTSSTSGLSESPPVVGPQILPCPEPPRRPGASEYEEFKDYEGVRNVEEMEDEQDDHKEDGENVISLHGTSKIRGPSYQGPAFPPQNVPADFCDGFNEGVLEKKTVGETVEEKALEWIEKELLARVVSEMTPARPDPTSIVRTSQSISSDTASTEPDLLAAIGLGGVQLFVDAGVPVDNDLVQNLILEVLKEKVASVLGYPKPQGEPSPKQDEPVDDYTDIETESEEFTRVGTPVQTPSAGSLPASGSVSHLTTPEQTIGSDLSSISAGDEVPVKDMKQEDNEIEEGPLDDSVHGSPVPTPVVTPIPSPRSPPPPVRTPETSEQEPPDSEKTDVATPELTLSSQKSPDESIEDLKEQTFVDEASEEEEIKKPEDDVVPTVKLVVEPAVTDSPSSVTTTTYSTQSTMGTVATEDEISEGEQLQPLVHVGQFSEGEFAAPGAMVSGLDHLTTMHEIPDDIFDSLDEGKNHDVFKHAVTGLLRLGKEPGEQPGKERGLEPGKEPGETSETTDESSRLDDQKRVGIETLIPQGSNGEDISRSEGEVDHDVVAALLEKIRRPPPRRVPQVHQSSGIHDSPSVGELLEEDDYTPVWRPLAKMTSDLSPGELNGRNQDHQNIAGPSDGTMSRPQGSSVFDSDENNNESGPSDEVSDLQSQTWNTNDITPKKTSSQIKSPGVIPHGSTIFPASPGILQVTEARRENIGHSLFMTSSLRESRPGNDSDFTIETIPDIETGVLDEDENVGKTTRLEVTLPSSEPRGTARVSEEPLTSEYDDTLGETSSISGGELP